VWRAIAWGLLGESLVCLHEATGSAIGFQALGGAFSAARGAVDLAATVAGPPAARARARPATSRVQRAHQSASGGDQLAMMVASPSRGSLIWRA